MKICKEISQKRQTQQEHNNGECFKQERVDDGNNPTTRRAHKYFHN